MNSSHYCLSDPSREIRLLDLLPASPPGILRGRIRRATVGNAPVFVAVSHVWGQEDREAPMLLDSGCGTRLVQVSHNLESLFVRLLDDDSQATFPLLWDEGSMVPMWIDMVCINQVDAGEKALQIPLMRDIYSQARAVIIWINEDSIDLRNAFSYLRHMLAHAASDSSDLSTLFDPSGWDAVKVLLRCGWFHRRWTIQEAVIPTNAIFLCGDDVMDECALFGAIDMAIRVLFARPKEVKKVQDAHVGSMRPVLVLRELKNSYKTGYQLSLLWLLEHLRHTRTTLAHDEIYALLGLCGPEEVVANPIRYDLVPEEVYKTFAVSHAQLHQNLEFLGLCAPDQRDCFSLGPLETPNSRPFAGPSWVPKWHSKRLQRCLGPAIVDKGQDVFNASYSLPVTVSFQDNKLIALGIQVDRIRVIGDFCHRNRRRELSDPNSRLFQQYFDFWMRPAGGSPSLYENYKCRAGTFARTISLLGIYLDPLPSPSDVVDMFCRWCSNSSLGKQLAECGLVTKEDAERSGQKTFVRMKRLLAWDPFVTEQGYIGLARKGSHIGDEIWIVGGCSVPLLLFPQTGNPAHYQVNGEVFLDGFMFDEAMETADTKIQTARTVTLL
ncbi:Uu.00g130060.m01.CDS01 [Anthostomella pinea]|uniref:Uu.00g130060.m01.CDS01 n=1 Tax=Anthostomella pinea TaxID=933095 RepID=A0AAI8YI94_9PEZI|nr:Uu.00g130060.m01.CDS01 [Anthostomella pinea]